MNIIKRENVIRWTACLCAFAIGVSAVFFTGSGMKETYAEEIEQRETNNTANLTKDKYEINLKPYERENRTIQKGANKTGITIIYDDNTWTYIDEYTDAATNGIGLGSADISSERARKIKELCIAPGYEAILMDDEAEKEKNGKEGYTYIVDGEKRNTSCHTTRILGPINIKGNSYFEFIDKAANGDYDSDLRSSWDIIKFARWNLWYRGKIKDNKEKIKEYYLNSKKTYDEDGDEDDLLEWIKDAYYAANPDLEKAEETEEGVGEIRDWWTTQIESGDDAVLLEEYYKKEEEATTDEDEYVKKLIGWVEDAYTEAIYDLDDWSKECVGMWSYNNHNYTSRIMGGILKEGDSKDNRNDVKLYNLRNIKAKKVAQKEGVYLIKGLYNVINEEERHSERSGDPRLEGVFEYISPEINETGNGNNFNRTVLRTNGHINSIMVVGNYKVVIEREEERWGGFMFTDRTTRRYQIQSEKGKITSVVDIWEGYDEDTYKSEIYNIEIIPKTDGMDYSDEVAFGLEGTKKSSKGESKYVKIYDMENRSQEASVTGYTQSNFKGQYLRFYMGELNNLGNDREIEKIGSLEVAPNTRIIFFNKEDIDIAPNTANNDKIVIDGPAYIPNLEDYFHRAYLENGELIYNKFDAKAFLIQYSKNTYKGVSLYNYKNGVGTFKTEGVDKLEQKLAIKDYVPESITIRGNYFVKFHDKEGNLIKTVIGPVSNYNIQSDEYYENKDMYIELAKRTYTDSRGNQVVSPIKYFEDEVDKLINIYVIDYFWYCKYSHVIDIGDTKKDVYKKNWKNELANKYNELGNQLIKWLEELMEKIEGIIESEKNNAETEAYFGREGEGYRGKWASGSTFDKLRNDYVDYASKIPKDTEIEANSELRATYDKWDGATMTITPLTQRDSKSRSTEDLAGIVLYQDKNYNGGAKLGEDVWTHFKEEDILPDEATTASINLGRSPGGKTTETLKKIEVEPDNIHSIRIVGSLAGNYEMTIKVEFGEFSGQTSTKTTRYNIPDINSFFGKEDSTTIVIKEITLKKVEDKELDTLLDTSGRSSEPTISISNFKKINTTENIQKKKIDSSTQYGLNNSEVDTIERTVYIASLEDIIKEIESKIKTNTTAKEFARLDYVYKYDPSDITKEDLVGVKVTRNIGTFNKGTGNTITYTDIIGQSKKDISREVEFKLNLLTALEVLNDKKIVLSDEFSYTDDARDVIITDHAYLDKVNGVEEKFTQKNIEKIDPKLYTIKKSDEGIILTQVFKNGIEYQDPVVNFIIDCKDKSGTANAKVEIVNTNYKDTVNKKEYKFELSENTQITLNEKNIKLNNMTDAKSVNGDFTLPKNGGEIEATVVLNILSKEEEPKEEEKKEGEEAKEEEKKEGEEAKEEEKKEGEAKEEEKEGEEEAKEEEKKEGEKKEGEKKEGEKKEGEKKEGEKKEGEKEKPKPKEWEKVATNTMYVMKIYLQETNSVSKVTIPGNSIVSKVYKDIMEVPAMLVKEVIKDQKNGEKSIENATEKDENRILYVPVCCHIGNGVYTTSFLLEQLGMKAELSGGKIKIYY